MEATSLVSFPYFTDFLTAWEEGQGRQFGDTVNRVKTEMVWICEERYWVYQEQDAKGGAARKKEERKIIEEVYRCGEGRCAEAGVTEKDAEDIRWKQMICCDQLQQK